ncbi:unnamed protein product [Urochloa decumbens]|uniref:Exportin-5 C-terminal domain-containing protein n=1 Tax=Urochloa decumbens TaxID=240449 RepID=A0ABC8YXK7_9POAL
MAADPAAAAAASAAAAISAVMDWRSTPDARAAAFAYLESVKSGDVRALASASFLLVRKDQTSEIRLHGFKMLQHLVRLRWDELSAAEQNEFANLTINLISDVVGPDEVWALKSQTAALVAEVVRREGVALWNTLLPSIVALSNSGPIEAELVAMILRWLPEDITVHNEDLEGDRRRSLLRGLTESLPQILPLLYSLLEKHFVTALSEHSKQQMVLAKQHAGTVTMATFKTSVEVMEEKLLRDLTREVCSVLWALASPGLNSGLPSLEQLGASNRMDSLKNLESFASSSLTGFLMLHVGAALPALRISVEVFSWTDSDAVTKVIPFCGALIHLAVASNQAELRQFVAKDLFSSIIQGLSAESNSVMSAELVGLCREIYVYLSDRDPAPRQVLLSLPHIKQEDLLAFDDSLSKTASPKEQKQHMRSLLLLATGNKLRALAAQKTTNVITNVTTRNRSSTAYHGSSAEEDGQIGLATLSST